MRDGERETCRQKIGVDAHDFPGKDVRASPQHDSPNREERGMRDYVGHALAIVAVILGLALASCASAPYPSSREALAQLAPSHAVDDYGAGLGAAGAKSWP